MSTGKPAPETVSLNVYRARDEEQGGHLEPGIRCFVHPGQLGIPSCRRPVSDADREETRSGVGAEEAEPQARLHQHARPLRSGEEPPKGRGHGQGNAGGPRKKTATRGRLPGAAGRGIPRGVPGRRPCVSGLRAQTHGPRRENRGRRHPARLPPVGSGTVARTSTLGLAEKARLAARAYIRHEHTDYDERLLAEGGGAAFGELDPGPHRLIKAEAHDAVNEFLARHRSPATDTNE